MKQITLQSPLDMHLHLRDNSMLNLVAPLSSNTFVGGIIMPNLINPIVKLEQVIEYKKRILKANNENDFIPFMTLFFKPYTKKFLISVKNEITAIKLYPAGITTNSNSGIKTIDTKSLAPTLNAMADLKIPLCIHGETEGFVMDREENFMKIYEELAIAFPKLTIIMEHITTKKAVDTVKKYDNLFATITVHHLLMTLDDVAGGMLAPHLFCKPIAKRPEDRKALLDIALSGNQKIMFGSDSAPHPKSKKESCGCAAGIFTAPIALQVLTELFEKYNKLENLQKFISGNAQKIYNIKVIKKDITLIKKDFIVPSSYDGFGETVVPMYFKDTLKWSIL